MNGFGDDGMVHDDTKRSVGLLLVADVPHWNPRRTAVLQRRGEFNQEKDWLPESWPGICQLTVHGRLKEGEEPLDGLMREMEEELGKDFAAGLKALNSEHNPMILLNSTDSVEGSISNYGIKIHQNLLNMIRLHPSSGGLYLLNQDPLDSIKVLDPQQLDKKVGVINRNLIVMWPEEREAVRLALGYHFHD